MTTIRAYRLNIIKIQNEEILRKKRWDLVYTFVWFPMKPVITFGG